MCDCATPSRSTRPERAVRRRRRAGAVRRGGHDVGGARYQNFRGRLVSNTTRCAASLVRPVLRVFRTGREHGSCCRSPERARHVLRCATTLRDRLTALDPSPPTIPGFFFEGYSQHELQSLLDLHLALNSGGAAAPDAAARRPAADVASPSSLPVSLDTHALVEAIVQERLDALESSSSVFETRGASSSTATDEESTRGLRGGAAAPPSGGDSSGGGVVVRPFSPDDDDDDDEDDDDQRLQPEAHHRCD